MGRGSEGSTCRILLRKGFILKKKLPLLVWFFFLYTFHRQHEEFLKVEALNQVNLGKGVYLGRVSGAGNKIVLRVEKGMFS